MGILWLNDPACQDESRVGGKAANLARLSASFRVPSGFALSAEVCASWQEALSGRETVPAELPLTSDLSSAYEELGKRCGAAEPAVAVRSSAVGEDGIKASFAGQLESYLNVTGAPNVADAVRRCVQSISNERVAAYGAKQGVKAGAAGMGVVVQQFVPCDASAVVFSANPVSGSRDEVMVNANWGLGESIVGGTATPDTFLIRKSDLAIRQVSVGYKERMTVPSSRGTRDVEVPRARRSQLSLTREQAVEVARLSLALEQASGWAVDVECGFLGTSLFLFQCRPITTLGAE